MIWTRYGRWDGNFVLNNYGTVVYKLPEPVKLSQTGMFSREHVPLLSHQNKVPENPLKGGVSEWGKRGGGR